MTSTGPISSQITFVTLPSKSSRRMERMARKRFKQAKPVATNNDRA